VIGFDEAIGRLEALAQPLGAEQVPLGVADGRVLAAPVTALISAPAADVATMDGYAVREADLAALPARLRVIGESFPGRGCEAVVAPGSCVRIFTGAPVPAGADRVVIQEVVRREGDHAVFEPPAGAARHIRAAGSDFREGDVLLGAGQRLGPRQLVAAAAADVAQVTVHRLPRLTIVATGDELTAPGTARARPGAIPESIGVGVAALARRWGAEVIGSRLLRDDLALLEAAGVEALDQADLVVVTGGASVGERDFARRLFGRALELVFSKVAIKPGKPVWLGRARGRLVLGLPGNPTSALVTARLFLAPLLAGIGGAGAQAALRWRELALGGPIEATGDRETFARARLEGGVVHPIANQDSAAQRALAEADLLVRLAPGTPPLPVGSLVPALDF